MTRQQATMRHVDEVLRVKRTVPPESQVNYIKEKSEEYWVGLADGVNAVMEEALHRANCYAGFQYQSDKPVELPSGDNFYPPTSHTRPDYVGWRRVYYARS